MKSKQKVALLSLLSCFILFSVSYTQAQTIEYVQGYVDATVSHDFQNTIKIGSIKAVELRAGGQALLRSSTCLTPTQIESIQTALLSSSLISDIAWEKGSACAGPSNDDKDSPPSATEVVKPVSTEAIPKTALFLPLIAGTREPRSSLRYERYESSSGSVNIGAISAGDNFPLVNWNLGDATRLQLGFEGGVFAIFNLDAKSSDLVNADYRLGLPLTYRDNKFSVRTRLFHQSSHLGDEFIIANPRITRVNLSYEALEIIGSYEFSKLRFFGGGASILHSEPDLDHYSVEGGVEFRYPHAIGTFDLVMGSLFSSSQELNWDFNQSYQMGLAISKFNDREVRLMLEYYRGSSPNGQFFDERLSYVGVGLVFEK